MITPGIYTHYKGNRYEVIGVGRHSETEEAMVLYRGLYDSPEFGPRPLWARPLASFTEILPDGRPRFIREE